MLKRAKENYCKDRFHDAIDNSRITWWLFDDLTYTARFKKKKGIGEINMGDYIVENNAIVYVHFYSHFCSVGTELDSKISRSNRSLLSYTGQNSFTSFSSSMSSDIEVKLISWA